MATGSDTPDSSTQNADLLPDVEHKGRFKRFLHHDMVGSGVMLGGALAAVIVANVGFEEWYHDFWHTEVGFDFGNTEVTKTLHHWVNDGLMAIFFFVVGLEIKRELLAGELASVRQAVLPAAAAVGGMVVPAVIYVLLNRGGEGAHGWGIPMATDIAFAAGCLALLKKHIAPALMIFLVALAIVDDLGAVAVIAIFYTDSIAFSPLIIGGCLILLSFAMSLAGVRVMWPYALLGVIIWIAFLESGVHATVAGVLLALTIPHTATYQTHNFTTRLHDLVSRFDDAEKLWPDEPPRIHDVMVNSRQQALLRHMERELYHVEAPLQRLEHNLEPLVVFIIMPIFAFANAGVHLDFAHIGEMITQPVALGIMFGLVLGKPMGIFIASFLAVKLGVASLPKGVEWKHIFGVGFLAGIGFTMSLFINEMAFLSTGDHAEELVAEGKIGIFLASMLAAVLGLAILRLAGNPDRSDA